jgi:hypothetical protein
MRRCWGDEGRAEPARRRASSGGIDVPRSRSCVPPHKVAARKINVYESDQACGGARAWNSRLGLPTH